mgnify:CR=1 FL=1
MQSERKAYGTSLRQAEEEEMDSETPSSLIAWLVRNVSNANEVLTFMAIPVRARIEQYLVTSAADDWRLGD